MGPNRLQCRYAVRLYDAANKFIRPCPGGLAMGHGDRSNQVSKPSVAHLQPQQHLFQCRHPADGNDMATTRDSLRNCRDRWKPRLYHPTERCSHHLRISQSQVDRQLFPCRSDPGLSFAVPLHGCHLRMGQDQSGHRTQIRTIPPGEQGLRLSPRGFWIIIVFILVVGGSCADISPLLRQAQSGTLPCFFWQS